MDREQLKTTIVEYLRKHYGGTLATAREDGSPQASGITYVSDGLLIYFAMDPQSYKKMNVDRNPEVGVAIFKDYYRWDKARGVQLGGKCEIVTDQDEIAKIEGLMVEKYPWVVTYAGVMEWAAKVGPVPYYRITPTTIAYLDYQRFGFNGYEVYIPRDGDL
jgi:general stress protein 26